MQAQQNTRKDKRNLAYFVSYYFNLNPNTIQGRLTIGFLSMGALSVALVVITHLQWRAGMQQTHYALTVATSSRYYSTDFESACKELVINNLQVVNVADETIETSYKRAISSRDTLLKFSKKWKTDHERQLLAEADAHFSQLRSMLQKDDSTAAAKAIPILQAFQSAIQKLVKVQTNEILAARTGILAVQQRLGWLVPLYISFAFVMAYFVGSFMIVGILSYVKQFKKYLRELGKGNLPQAMPETKNEMNALVKEINLLTDNLGQIKDFALYVGKGDFEKNIKVFNDEGDLGTSLSQMRDELRKVSLEEKKRFWVNEGFANFGSIIHGSHNLDDLCEKIVLQLVKFLHANQAGLFVVENESTGQPHLSLKACYAYDRKKYLQKQILPGQGLVGQTWQEGETTYLRQIPENYLRITSGLGDASPRYLLIVPLKVNGGVHGIVELASFRDFEPHEIRFVEAIGENIASTLANAKISENTQLLLEQSRVMAGQMAAQEEQMRQHMEELMATQEEMIRKEAESALLSRAINQSLATIEFTTEGIVQTANDNFLKLMGYSLAEIQGKHHRMFVMPDEAESPEYQLFWDQLQNGVTQSREFRRVTKTGEVVWLRSSYMVIQNASTQTLKVLKLAQDITGQISLKLQSEQQAEELQAQHEELRQNMEELMSAQEEMGRSQRETARKQVALDALLNNSNFASVTIDTEYRVVAANAALKKIYEKLGVSMDVGSQVLDLFSKHFGEATAAKRKAQYDRAFAGETFTDHEQTVMNGRTMYTEIYHNPIRDGKAEISGVAISAKDVSAQKHREQQLEQDLHNARHENERLAQCVEELTARLPAQPDQPAAPVNTGLA